MKFVVILRAEHNLMTEGLSGRFEWEVRELLKDSTSTELLERTGPTMARGLAVDKEAAKTAAESAAELLASEAIYIYNTVA